MGPEEFIVGGGETPPAPAHGPDTSHLEAELKKIQEEKAELQKKIEELQHALALSQQQKMEDSDLPPPESVDEGLERIRKVKTEVIQTEKDLILRQKEEHQKKADEIQRQLQLEQEKMKAELAAAERKHKELEDQHAAHIAKIKEISAGLDQQHKMIDKDLKKVEAEQVYSSGSGKSD